MFHLENQELGDERLAWRVWCTTCRDCCGCVQGCVCERGVGGGALDGEHWCVFLGFLCSTPHPFLWCGCGGFLLSHTLSGAVPSALLGLASGFGMLPGVSPIL